MVNWNSSTEFAREKEIFVKLQHALLGLYLWEFVISFDFDWQYISRKKQFHWPLVFYFAGRYSYLFGAIGSIINADATAQINCQQLYIFAQLFVSASIGFATITLSIRTMVIWSWNKYVVIPLILAIMGHWALLLRKFPISTLWIPSEGCVIQSANVHLSWPVSAYSMVFDFMVLCLTGWKVTVTAHGCSKLFTRILRGGLVYFAIVFLAHLIATIFYFLYLNAITTAIAGFPVAVVCTISACRVVRHLLSCTYEASQVKVDPASGPSIAFVQDTPPCMPTVNKIPDGPGVDTIYVDLRNAINAAKSTCLDSTSVVDKKFDSIIDVEAQVTVNNSNQS